MKIPSLMKTLFIGLFSLALISTLKAQFGPDHNLPMLKQETYLIRVPAGMQLQLDFQVNARSENAVCVYIANPYNYGRLTKILERGNYRRHLNSWVSEPMLQDTDFIISGWHKQAWGSSNPWWQSPLRLHNYTPYSASIGFDDSDRWGRSDGDFNDLLVHYQVF